MVQDIKIKGDFNQGDRFWIYMTSVAVSVLDHFTLKIVIFTG
jgi:hypothetical protein